MDQPGTKGKPFYIQFNHSYFKKGNILTVASKGARVEVLKVYRKTLWRRFLMWLGFKTRLFQCKVIEKL